MEPRTEIPKASLNVLLVEDNPKDAQALQESLENFNLSRYDLTHVGNLDEALKRLWEEKFDLVLLDLSLPDSLGLNAIVRVHEQVPEVPIIVLAANDDESLAIRAVQEGTQDYLVKGQVSGNMLERSIRYAIERHRMLAQLRAMSLADELTGLYNRRGFMTLVKQHLKVAARTKIGKYLLFVDLDGLKSINDTLGHQEGDKALVDAANILKETFRDSDIIARIGGDEFTVFLTTGANVDILPSRLQKNLDSHNKKRMNPYNLSMSVGLACYDPEKPCSLDELLSRADALMYEQKQKKKSAKIQIQ